MRSSGNGSSTGNARAGEGRHGADLHEARLAHDAARVPARDRPRRVRVQAMRGLRERQREALAQEQEAVEEAARQLHVVVDHEQPVVVRIGPRPAHARPPAPPAAGSGSRTCRACPAGTCAARRRGASAAAPRASPPPARGARGARRRGRARAAAAARGARRARDAGAWRSAAPTRRPPRRAPRGAQRRSRRPCRSRRRGSRPCCAASGSSAGEADWAFAPDRVGCSPRLSAGPRACARRSRSPSRSRPQLCAAIVRPAGQRRRSNVPDAAGERAAAPLASDGARPRRASKRLAARPRV